MTFKTSIILIMIFAHLLHSEDGNQSNWTIGADFGHSINRYKIQYPEYKSNDYARYINIENSNSFSLGIFIDFEISRRINHTGSFTINIIYENIETSGKPSPDLYPVITDNKGIIIHEDNPNKSFEFNLTEKRFQLDIIYNLGLFEDYLLFMFVTSFSYFNNINYIYKYSFKDSIYPKLDKIESTYLNVISYENNGKTAILDKNKILHQILLSFNLGIKYDIFIERYRISPYLLTQLAINRIMNQYDLNINTWKTGLMIGYQL